MSKLEERIQREVFLILWFNGFQKVYLSLYPCKIQIMRSFSLSNWVISVTVFWHKKSWIFWLLFLMFCTQISITSSNQTISTSIICAYVLVSSLINIQKENMINNFHVRIKTGKQRIICLSGNFINSSIVTADVSTIRYQRNRRYHRVPTSQHGGTWKQLHVFILQYPWNTNFLFHIYYHLVHNVIPSTRNHTTN